MSDTFLHLKLMPFMLKLLISDKEEESLLVRHVTDIKSYCVFVYITGSRSGSYFRFSMKDLSNHLS
jgi:hypothetical protein